MAQFERWFTQDLAQKIETRHCETVVFSADNLSVVVGVSMYDGGEAADQTGASAVCYAIRADGNTVEFAGEIDGNKVFAPLPQSCFVAPGPLAIMLQVTEGTGDTAVKTTVLKVIFTVEASQTGEIVDPGHVIPDVADIIAMLDQMEQATEAANTAATGAANVNIAQSKTGNVITITTTNRNGETVSNTLTDPSPMIADTFDPAVSYTAGQYVIQEVNGVKGLYRFTQDHAAGAWTGTDAEQITLGEEMEEVNSVVMASLVDNWDMEGINRLIWMGLGPKAVPTGTALVTEKETGVSVTIGTSVEEGTPGISGATVNEDTFINKIGSSMAGAYEFTYDGAAWQLNGEAVEIAQYGITVTGTPATGDEIVVHVAADEIPLNVLDHDYHTPVSANVPHTCTVGMRDCYQNFAFDAPEGLIHVVDGLAEGSHFYLTLDHGAYNATTAQDGAYGGTLGADQTIPAGGYLRHTAIGYYQSSAYTPEQITSGKWIAYDANFVQIGAQIATDTGDTTGTNFGTATAAIYQGNSAHVNFTTRNAYGSNRLDQSNWLQYANAEGTGWWVQKNEWDFPPSGVATLKGLMTGLDPVMKASMVPVKIRFALANCDGGGYVDVETKVFPLSMSEVNFGENNGVWETSFGLDNTLIQRPLAFYTGAQNADRIKTLNGAARWWFLRGALPSLAVRVRLVNASGALYDSNASSANGLVAAWVIGNPNIASA